MKIILSPSKTQNHERNRKEKGRDILKEDMTKKLFNYLKSLSKEELKKELDIQGNLLDRTYKLYQDHSFEDATIPAMECYNGAVFKQINLYKYWQGVMKDYFSDTDLIVNLASNEYSKVVENNYQGKIVDFYFKEEKEDGSLKTIGYYVKQNRGKLLNELIKNKIKTLDEIKKNELDGYKFDKERSEKNNYKFIKPYQK